MNTKPTNKVNQNNLPWKPKRTNSGLLRIVNMYNICICVYIHIYTLQISLKFKYLIELIQLPAAFVLRSKVLNCM